MEIRRTEQAVYDLKYHLVWIPKYRKHVLTAVIAGYLKEVFNRIAEEYGFAIDTIEVVKDHVHIFLKARPRHIPAEVVQIMKRISGRELFKRFPKIKKQLWAGELWNEAFFVRSVRGKVTADIIRTHIEYQYYEDNPSQLIMFEKS